MHRYDAVPMSMTTGAPPLSSLRLHDALDLVAYAALDRTLGWATWPEVWHLDDHGAFVCGWKASSVDSITRWADDPSELLEMHAICRRRTGCTDRCVVVDSRPRSLFPEPSVDDADVAAFGVVHGHLAAVGVELLDVVVFDDDQHWWSLLEMTSGTTRWPAADAGRKTVVP